MATYISPIEPGPDFQLPATMGLGAPSVLALRLKYSHADKGIVLRDKNGVVYVPYEATRGGWYAVTLHDPKGVYPPGGYNILVGNQDVLDSTIVALDGVPVTKEPTITTTEKEI
jgi:hypothetical protein